MKSTKGITLIALVITIIVLLILAGITISVIFDNGIIEKSKIAADKYSDAKVQEQIKLEYAEYKMKLLIEPIEVTTFLKTNLENKYEDKTVDVSVSNDINKPIINVVIEDVGNYVINNDQVEENEEYVSESGTVYHKYEIYEGTANPGTRYRDCDKMIAIELPNFVMSNPYATTESMFSGCTSLKSIKFPVAQGAGHYVFSFLPNLECVELGSIGHTWSGAGYFMKSDASTGYTSVSFGNPAGLTIIAYMSTYNATAGFGPGVPAPNTTIIIRSSETGEELQPGN